MPRQPQKVSGHFLGADPADVVLRFALGYYAASTKVCSAANELHLSRTRPATFGGTSEAYSIQRGFVRIDYRLRSVD
jgi:hypothetical protein